MVTKTSAQLMTTTPPIIPPNLDITIEAIDRLIFTPHITHKYNHDAP
jgi:hypothetical protein